VAQRLDGGDLAGGTGFTISLITIDPSGFPRVALLSVGEVLAIDERRLALALWPGSTTAAALTDSRSATLWLVADEVAYTIHVVAERREDLPAGGMAHAFFIVTVQDVLADEVSYARLTSGVVFELPDPERVISRWQSTVDAMRARLGKTALERGPSNSR
jgi:hypothetical protein